jgi:hypothetical protein
MEAHTQINSQTHMTHDWRNRVPSLGVREGQRDDQMKRCCTHTCSLGSSLVRRRFWWEKERAHLNDAANLPRSSNRLGR